MTMRILLPCLLLLVSACSTTKESSIKAASKETPLNDLNLVTRKIPDVLHEARLRPYRVPAEQDCASIVTELAELDRVLGPDVDEEKEVPGLLEQGQEMVSEATIGAVRNTVNAIPFRSVVRGLSGAAEDEKETEAAVAAGMVRRGYLKGWRKAIACS